MSKKDKIILQIQKLETTWHLLRQKYTDSAFNFEAKLRPTLKSMNDCSNPQAPNTVIPVSEQ
jgi:SH2 domain-containing protein 3C